MTCTVQIGARVVGLGLVLCPQLSCATAERTSDGSTTSAAASASAQTSTSATASATASASAQASTSAAASASAQASTRCEPSCLDIERCDAGRCVAACPDGEVYVPATGTKGFQLGDGVKGSQVDKPHTVVLTTPFCMDATEVTVGAYKACVDAGKCEQPRIWGQWINYPKAVDHPVNKVHYDHAQTYCTQRGQSLPTEAQWEWAATGGDGRKWAWGNELPTCEHADFTPGILHGPASDDGCNGGGTSPVGSHPKGAKRGPAGNIHDLTGNVGEWCLDNYRPYKSDRQVDPLPLDYPRGAHVVRGGGWNRSHRGVRAQFRGGAPVDYHVPGLGFRCVRNPRGVDERMAKKAAAQRRQRLGMPDVATPAP